METQSQPQYRQPATNWSYQRQGFVNLLHMGHCAPTVMQTILDITSRDVEWLVRLSAGMPGGIGYTGHECGGVTSALVQLGIRFGLRNAIGGLPEIFDRGYSLCQNFVSCHRTLDCKLIRSNDHFPRHCIPPVLRSPGMFMQAQDGYPGVHIPAGMRENYVRLFGYLAENKFHCAQAVFNQLGYLPQENNELFVALAAFIGGTLFLGRTCSAFTAGVMAIGLKIGEIEDSPLRVVRLLAIMTVDGNAFDDRLNKFNHSMNMGFKLSKWFAREFGDTQCQAITHCDFSSPQGVSDYVDNNCISRCKQIAEQVAAKVQLMTSG